MEQKAEQTAKQRVQTNDKECHKQRIFVREFARWAEAPVETVGHGSAPRRRAGVVGVKDGIRGEFELLDCKRSSVNEHQSRGHTCGVSCLQHRRGERGLERGAAKHAQSGECFSVSQTHKCHF